MSYEELKEMLRQNAVEAAKPVPEGICPQCLFPKLKINERGEKHCPICGWGDI